MLRHLIQYARVPAAGPFVAVLVGSLLLAPCGLAQERSDSPFAVGFQSSLPAWGVSGRYDVTPTLTAQAVVDLLGTLTAYSGRVLYRFDQRDTFDLYGYGALGAWRYRDVILGDTYTETALGFGGGGGVEVDLQALFGTDSSPFPPLVSSLELGVSLVSFDEVSGSVSTLSLGVGLHYLF